MARRKPAAKREILADPVYNSVELAKFINIVMRCGKKSIAEKIVYKALEIAAERVKKDKQSHHGSAQSSAAGKGAKKTAAPKTASAKGQSEGSVESLEILRTALHEVSPKVEVKSRRVGGATYQVPVEVTHDRAVALAMRWIVDAAKGRGEKGMVAKLAAEIAEAYKGAGSAVKFKLDMHRMAEANKAFAHYRW